MRIAAALFVCACALVLAAPAAQAQTPVPTACPATFDVLAADTIGADAPFQATPPNHQLDPTCGAGSERNNGGSDGPHAAEQPSPPTKLQSSQSSPASVTQSPQLGTRVTEKSPKNMPLKENVVASSMR